MNIRFDFIVGIINGDCNGFMAIVDFFYFNFAFNQF